MAGFQMSTEAGRKRPPKTIEELRAALPAWALADRCHFMRHVFFNRPLQQEILSTLAASTGP